ncbi:hypothetical protein [Mycolicibacterium thermoresistibile]
MLIAAVLSLCAAVATAAVGLRLLTRPVPADTGGQLMRAMAPTQLAAAAMLTVGGVVGLAAPQTGWVVLIVCVIGAVGTIAAGSWQSAKAGAEVMATQSAGSCGTACATCTLTCSS